MGIESQAQVALWPKPWLKASISFRNEARAHRQGTNLQLGTVFEVSGSSLLITILSVKEKDGNEN